MQSISMAASPEETADPPCEEAVARVSAKSRGDPVRGGIAGGGGDGGGFMTYCMNELKKPLRKASEIELNAVELMVFGSDGGGNSGVVAAVLPACSRNLEMVSPSLCLKYNTKIWKHGDMKLSWD